MELPLMFTAPLKNVKQQEFSPYENNGGTTVGVAGKNFCIIAADTRLSEGYSILSRMTPKITQLTSKCVLATSGMRADISTLHKNLLARMEFYQHQNGREMSTTAVAQLLSNMLYWKRFFPYYCFNVLGGVDEEGLGCVFSYDAVGSFQRMQYSSSGTGQRLVQPVLDNQMTREYQPLLLKTDLSLEEAEELVKDVFNSAGERDIYTGDYVDVFSIVTDKGIAHSRFDLKFD